MDGGVERKEEGKRGMGNGGGEGFPGNSCVDPCEPKGSFIGNLNSFGIAGKKGGTQVDPFVGVLPSHTHSSHVRQGLGGESGDNGLWSRRK